MEVHYDKEADAAYIYFSADVPATSQSIRDSIPLTLPHGKGNITLDFNKDGNLVGMEVLDASLILPEEVISSATIL